MKKFKKFGVVWYIPFEMTAKSAKGGDVRYPPSNNMVNNLYKIISYCKFIFNAKSFKMRYVTALKFMSPPPNLRLKIFPIK